jgi:hypothetical protein
VFKADRCDIYLGPTWFYYGAREGAISTSTRLTMIKEILFFRLLPLLLTPSDDHETLPDVRNYRVLAVAFPPRPFCPAIARRQAPQVLILCHFMPHRGEVLRPARKLRHLINFRKPTLCHIGAKFGLGSNTQQALYRFSVSAAIINPTAIHLGIDRSSKRGSGRRVVSRVAATSSQRLGGR